MTIDIPIGLIDHHPRPPDVAARAALPGKASCVFPSPIRCALHAPSRPVADQITRQICKKGVGAQSFALYGKVSEVDDLLQQRPELRARIFEVHPELCFAKWFGSPIMESKHEREGSDIRRQLVEGYFGRAAASSLPRGAQLDDVLDAYAALWTAIRIAAGHAIPHPKQYRLDSTGIRMAIWA